MSGYTPVFASIYDGTLYGRWPGAAVFASLLPLANARGEIDMSLKAIAGRTGWPLDLLEAGIRQLSEPDTGSRTSAEDGRRMVPLDPTRPWGWRLVNHAQYRERARLLAKDAARTASGRDAERKRAARERAAAGNVPPCPPASPGVPLSDSDTNTDINPKSAPDGAHGTAGKRGKAKGTDSTLPDDFTLTPDRKAYAERNLPGVNAEGLFENFALWARSEGKTCRDWSARWQRWVRNCRTDSDDPRFAGKYPKQSGGVAWQ
jgi:hypothetical protein